MGKNQLDLPLLPTPYRKIALGLLILSVLFVVVTKTEMLLIDRGTVKTISMTGILVSLLVLALTKNKIEDELTSRIRLRAFAGSFIFGVGYTIVWPYVNIIFRDSFFSEKGSTELLLAMFIFYFLICYFMLKKR